MSHCLSLRQLRFIGEICSHSVEQKSIKKEHKISGEREKLWFKQMQGFSSCSMLSLRSITSRLSSFSAGSNVCVKGDRRGSETSLNYHRSGSRFCWTWHCLSLCMCQMRSKRASPGGRLGSWCFMCTVACWDNKGIDKTTHWLSHWNPLWKKDHTKAEEIDGNRSRFTNNILFCDVRSSVLDQDNNSFLADEANLQANLHRLSWQWF